jgi:excinuclease UvrABC nuclease subunit
MKRTRRRAPYNPEGRTNFPRRGLPGVYLIYDGEVPVYIGHGKDVYKPLYRHFQSWTDSTQVRVTYPKTGYLVRVVYVKTLTIAQKLEKALILKYGPRDNPYKFEQYSLTADLDRLATSAENAPWMPTNEETPF